MSSIEEFIGCDVFAVAGSFRKRSKYAYKVLLDLLEKGKKVYPINPKGGQVEGLQVYKDVKKIPARVGGISLVTPPEVTEKIVKQCKETGIKYVWMQPGAQSRAAIDFCREHSIEVIDNACLLRG